MVVLKSKIFIPRHYKKGDEKSLQKNINDKDIYRYTLRIPYPYKSKDAKKFIKNSINQYKKRKKTEIKFAIDIDGEVVGGVGFMNIEKHKAEIGYWLSRKYWNKGIMTKAVRLVTNFGFNKLKLRRIQAGIFSMMSSLYKSQSAKAFLRFLSK